VASERVYLPRAICFDRINAEISFPFVFSSSLRELDTCIETNF